MGYPCSCTIELPMPDPDTARNVARALELDNAGYIEMQVRGSTILAGARADDIMSLRHTVDDFLACLNVALASHIPDDG